MKTPISAPFLLGPELRAWAEKAVPRLDIDWHHGEFCDHWQANGQCRADWQATWRNWMRRANDGIFNTKPHLRATTLRTDAQNVLEFKTGTLSRAEALARWQALQTGSDAGSKPAKEGQ